MEKTRKESLWCEADTYHCRSAKAKIYLVKGKGNPNEVDFSDRISALYSLAYAIKMLLKNAMKNKTDNEIADFTVYPLEGFWKK